MARKILLPLLAVMIIVAMVMPGCGEATPTTFALTMAADPTVGGTATDVTGASPYAEGAQVAIYAEAADGYKFVNWDAPAGSFANANSALTQFTMPAAAVTVTAYFEELPEDTYAVTLLANPPLGGIVTDLTGEFSYAEGATVEVRADFASGFYFIEWESNIALTLDPSDTAQQVSFEMPAANVILTAYFGEDPVPFFGAIDAFYKERFGNPVLFEDELEERMANLKAWAAADNMNHFWVTSGPFYLDSVDSSGKTAVLKRFAGYDLDANKWLFLMDDIGPSPPIHQGAWVDEVQLSVESSPAAAFTKIGTCEIDIFASTLADAAMFDDAVLAGYTLWFSAGNYMGFSFNPVPTVDGKFNPFSLREVREGMNWAFDRTYIKNQVYTGLAIEKFTALSSVGADRNDPYPRSKAVVDAIEANYAYSLAAAHANYAALLDAEADVYWSGDILVHTSGEWRYASDDSQVTLDFYIRSEDERTEAGQYASLELQALGFAVTEYIQPSGVCSPIVYGDPEAQVWHAYTEGWIGGAVPRDEGWVFGFLHTVLGAPWMGPLWEYYGQPGVTDPDFYDAAYALWMDDFESMEERHDLFEIALWGHLKDSFRIYGVDNLSYTMGKDLVNVAADGAGGVSASHMWPLTVHWHDIDGNPIPGGTVKIALVNLFQDPWNPIAGSNWVFDAFPIRGMNDRGTYPDTRDGLYWPGRIEKAEVLVSEDLPPISHGIGLTPPHDWVTLDTRAANHDDLRAPDDAWYNWNATLGRFITVEEQMVLDPAWSPYGRRYSAAYYETGTFGIPLHDGSEMSAADFLYGVMLGMARGNPDSGALYDPAEAATLSAFLASHKGVRFITDEEGYDLIVETWTNSWSLDVELMVSTWFPVYRQGMAPWHTLAIGCIAEMEGLAAFGEAKADFIGKEWMNWVDGPTLPVLRGVLDRF